MTLIEELTKEHKIIWDFLNTFESMTSLDVTAPSPGDYQKAFLFIQNYVDKVHHEKEEKHFFPIVFETDLLKGGGPKCNLFFGLFLENRFLEKFKGEIQKNETIPPYQPRIEIQEILDANSPLSIPLEDHQAGYYALQLMKAELKNCQEGASRPSQRMNRIAHWYIRMLREHIRKEDECLFVRLKLELNEEQTQRLNTWTITEEEKNLIQSSLKDLEYLKKTFSPL